MLWGICVVSSWSDRVPQWQSWWCSEEVGLWLALTLLRGALLLALGHAEICLSFPLPYLTPFPAVAGPLGLLCQCPHHPSWMQTGCEHCSQTGLHSCAEREEKVAGLNLLSSFGKGGAGAALWMQNFPLHLSSHGFTCSAKLLHALTTRIGGKGVWRVASSLKTEAVLSLRSRMF